VGDLAPGGGEVDRLGGAGFAERIPEMLIGGRFLPLRVRAQQQVFSHGQLVPPVVLAEQGGVLKNLLHA